MCDPVTLAVSTFMVGAASSVASYGASKQQAQAQDDLYAANKQNADQAAVFDHQNIALRRSQEDEATGQKNFDNYLETTRKAATAEVGAGEAGISGLSVDGLIRDIYGSGDRTTDTLMHNNEMTQAQLANQDLSVEATRRDRINSVRRGVQPSGLALGLNIASSAVGSASSYRTMTTPRYTR